MALALSSLHKIIGYIGLLPLSLFYGGDNPIKTAENYLKQNKPAQAADLLNTLPYKKMAAPDLAHYYSLKAEANEKLSHYEIACEYYLLARKKYMALDSIVKVHDIDLNLANLSLQKKGGRIFLKKNIGDYIEYALKNKDSVRISKGYSQLAIFFVDDKKYNKSLRYYREALKYVKKTEGKSRCAIINNIANLYNEDLHKPDSGLYYLKLNLINIKKIDDPDCYFFNYQNTAASYFHLNNYKESIRYLKKADSLPLQNYAIKERELIYGGLSVNYEALNNYKEAFKYLTLSKQYADSINETKQEIAINDIQTKYKTREKELENKALKSNIKTNRILLYTFIGLLAASLSIGFLIIKNARRKQKIAQQQTLIEQQKTDRVLKDYELSSIDLMLEGQEKERQRLANDLHDNLGSMLATLKLNFENLRLRKNEVFDEQTKLYDKTDELLEEAYQKVRRIAHSKNAGVFANEGLIPAIKKLADKVSIPGKLAVEVIPFGFTERLDNTLEIAIFRIIQELSTNIIKHAKATEATIHLTNHDESINLIIEDNGVGFNPEKDTTADGMGLASIRKKVSHLNGTFNIDSMPGRGTTILIDLPV